MNQKEKSTDKTKQAKVVQFGRKSPVGERKKWVIVIVILALIICSTISFIIHNMGNESSLAAVGNEKTAETDSFVQNRSGNGDTVNSEAAEPSQGNEATGRADENGSPSVSKAESTVPKQQTQPTEKPVPAEEQTSSKNPTEKSTEKAAGSSSGQNNVSDGQKDNNPGTKPAETASNAGSGMTEQDFQAIGQTIQQYNEVASKAANVKISPMLLSMSGLSEDVNAVKSAQAELDEQVKTYDRQAATVKATDIHGADKDNITTAGKEITRLKAELDKKVADLKDAKKEMDMDTVSALMQEIAKNFNATGQQIKQINAVLEKV